MSSSSHTASNVLGSTTITRVGLRFSRKTAWPAMPPLTASWCSAIARRSGGHSCSKRASALPSTSCSTWNPSPVGPIRNVAPLTTIVSAKFSRTLSSVPSTATGIALGESP